MNNKDIEAAQLWQNMVYPGLSQFIIKDMDQ